VTPWLRTTRRYIRLLLVLAVALPAYDALTEHTTTAYTTGPGPRSSATPGPADPPTPYGADHPARGTADRPGHSAHGGREPMTGATPEPQYSTSPDHGRIPVHGHRHGHSHSPVVGPSPVSPMIPIPPIPSDSASASYRPTVVEPTRAGSRAGEGRMRPGRPDGPAAEVEGDDDPVPTQAPGTAQAPGTGRAEEPETAQLPTMTPTASTVPDEAGLDHSPPRNAATQHENTSGPVLQILPLGTGLVLIGLGLALALLGLRLRRD
jgi:hypothetical protein